MPLLLSSLLLGHSIIELILGLSAGLDCVRADRIRQRSDISCIMPPKEVFGEPDAEAVTCGVADRVMISTKSRIQEDDPDTAFVDRSLLDLRSIPLSRILILTSLIKSYRA